MGPPLRTLLQPLKKQPIQEEAMLKVCDLCALPSVPSTPFGVRKWFKRLGVSTKVLGKSFTFGLTDPNLPAAVRLAYVERECERAGLPSGTSDDAAHELLAAAPARTRAKAEEKAKVARILVSAARDLPWSEKVALVAKMTGNKGTSEPTLRRILSDVEGVDPINFAPALMADYGGGRPPAESSEEAWAFFLTSLRDAGEGYPLKSAWRDANDLAPGQGWTWPSFPTVFRRWAALTKADQLRIRLGAEEAARRLAQPALRDKTSILPLEWVSLDGRTQDFWAVDDDGKCRRYTFLALVDCASNAVLGWEGAMLEFG